MAVRAIRGAVQVAANDRDHIISAVGELVLAVLQRNDLEPADVISVLFTATADLTAEFPAYAARLAGLSEVPLMCASEIAVPGALPRTLRLLAHVETGRDRSDLQHVYLGGAEVLRPDLSS